jgi:serine/threonine-protein kinase
MSAGRADRLNAALSGRYEIERALGEGGMATVYLARDLKHGRNVALKVLRPELAAVVGAERFLAEIRTTASLQHPHILPLHDSGEADGLLFYVMPAVEGESLEERLEREHQLPVDEAVRIATNVAEALDYAHRHGVIHRDIKPANILLLDGKPVISDFGIALAVTSGGAGRLTETGLSLGTPHYMSPEQATGDGNVGPATDIWALGCVLYEMLVGEPPYVASTPQAVLGKIITAEPPSANEARRSVPANVDAAIRKALEKVPADRFGSAGDLITALCQPTFHHGQGTGGALAAHQDGSWKRLAFATSALMVVLAGVLAWELTRPPTNAGVERFGMSDDLGAGLQGGFSLSPDGSFLVYPRRSEAGETVLMLKRAELLEATPIAGTEGASTPVVSPDGTRLVFRQGRDVRLMTLPDGAPTTLGEGYGPIWGGDGYVYAGSIADSGLVRWPVTGGAAERVTRQEPGEQLWITQVLPGGVWALIEVDRPGAVVEVRALELATGVTEFLAFGMGAQYVPTGHLVYLAGPVGAGGVVLPLVAVPFDVRQVRPEGSAQTLYDSVTSFSVSAAGKLVYSRAGSGGNLRQLVWVDRSGEVTPVEEGWTFDRGPDVNQGWSVSPDGSKIAFAPWSNGGYDVWVKELGGGPHYPITFDPGYDWLPRWGPDGVTVTFLSYRRSVGDVWSTRADGTGGDRLVWDFERPLMEAEWSADGVWLLGKTSAGGTAGGAGSDLVALRPGLDTVAIPVVASPEYSENHPALSTDGRWLAYASGETGRWEVSVRPFPDAGSSRTRISVNGGQTPKWSRDGRELFFLDGTNQIVAVEVRTAGEFERGPLRTLFQVPAEIDLSGFNRAKFDVHPDGERFLFSQFVQGDRAADQPTAILVNNFFEELRQRVPN